MGTLDQVVVKGVLLIKLFIEACLKVCNLQLQIGPLFVPLFHIDPDAFLQVIELLDDYVDFNTDSVTDFRSQSSK